MPNKKRGRRVQGAWSDVCYSHTDKSDESNSVYKFIQPSQMPSKRPSNFSWIIEGVLAGSALPSCEEHFQYYKEQGISHVVTLTHWKPNTGKLPPGMKVSFMPVEEFQPPTIKQLEDFVDIVDKAKLQNEGIVAHCHWGRGRTGTMLAAYLVKYHNMLPRDAIREVRAKRPMSIETHEQENVIYDFAETINSQGHAKNTCSSS